MMNYTTAIAVYTFPLCRFNDIHLLIISLSPAAFNYYYQRNVTSVRLPVSIICMKVRCISCGSEFNYPVGRQIIVWRKRSVRSTNCYLSLLSMLLVHRLSCKRTKCSFPRFTSFILFPSNVSSYLWFCFMSKIFWDQGSCIGTREKFIVQF